MSTGHCPRVAGVTGENAFPILALPPGLGLVDRVKSRATSRVKLQENSWRWICELEGRSPSSPSPGQPQKLNFPCLGKTGAVFHSKLVELVNQKDGKV